MSKRRDPTLFLGVSDLAGTPLDTPLFAAVHVTHRLVVRLRQLSRLCRTGRIAWLATREIDSPVYWDVTEDQMTETTTTWHVVGEEHYAELTARRAVPGGYGCLEFIGQTALVSLSELANMREQHMIVDFRDCGGRDEVNEEPFAMTVMQRVRTLGLRSRSQL